MVVLERLQCRCTSNARHKWQHQHSRTTYRVLSLFDVTMVVLNPIVEVRFAAVRNVSAERFTSSPRMRGMPVRGHALWCLRRLAKTP